MIASFKASLRAAPGVMPLPLAVVVTCSTLPTSGVCVRFGALDAAGCSAAFSPQALKPKARHIIRAGRVFFTVVFIDNSIAQKKSGANEFAPPSTVCLQQRSGFAGFFRQWNIVVLGKIDRHFQRVADGLDRGRQVLSNEQSRIGCRAQRSDRWLEAAHVLAHADVLDDA